MSRLSDIISEVLYEYLMQTKPQAPGLQSRAMLPGVLDGSAGKRMAQAKGPIKAATAKKIATERERIMQQLRKEGL